MQTLTNTQPSSVSASVSRSLLFHALGARLPVEDVVLVAQHYEVIALKETRVWGANVTGPLQEARNVIPRKERPCTRASAMKSQRMSVASKGGGGSRDMKAFKQTLRHSNRHRYRHRHIDTDTDRHHTHTHAQKGSGSKPKTKAIREGWRRA